MAEELKQTASGAPGEGQLSTGVDFLSRALKMFFGILAAFIIVSLGWFLIFGGSFIVSARIPANTLARSPPRLL